MRIFPLYAPRLIAKHARIFRDGVVMVRHLGRLEFRNGRFVMPERPLPKVRTAITELNELLAPQPAPSF
ncbi:DUF1107 domain-containing protein [Ferrimonas balearica]|uniref:DUF1107 domain-containing protein n=1 Tax=Ferrimonas balearica TaxID=44012 RepID=UPI001C9A03D9|nr:DUF1107 domain-containing protein [Ferrimonas balearica]MBY5993314.1 DUF1107 domain-containing protein [Ferrimonas balearica]